MSTQNTKLIVDKLQNKAGLKQHIYRVLQGVFTQLKGIAEEMANEINEQLPADTDENIRVEFKDISLFEFRLKFSGDTLAFNMHSNIVTLNDEHDLMKGEYVQEDSSRGYFGSIRVYDFLSDSFKYNRYHDQGILMARLLVNHEQHYYVDSGIKFRGLKQNIAKNTVSKDNLRFFIENAMLMAIDIDLIAPDYKDIFTVSLQQHFENNQGDAGTKLGFQMSYER